MTNNITLKQRVALFWGATFFFFIMSVGIPWLGWESLSEYLDYPKSIIFSSLTVSALICPLIFLPIIRLFWEPIVYGQQADIHVQKLINKITVLGAITIVVLTIGFKVIYQNTLNSKGYIECEGIPSGWMPGMATQYVTDPNLCEGYIKHHK